jgi:hypothetical protein
MKYGSIIQLAFILSCVSCRMLPITTVTTSSITTPQLPVAPSFIVTLQPTVGPTITRLPSATKETPNAWKEFGLQGQIIRSIAINPFNFGEIMAGTDDGIFKIKTTMDGWDSLNIKGCGPLKPITEIRIDPVSPSMVYAIMKNRLCQSIDSGASWKSVYETTDGYPLQILWFSPFYNVLYTGRAGELVRSENHGNSWTRVFWGRKGQTDISGFTFLSNDPPSIYFWSDGHLFFSPDGISQWEIRNTSSIPALRIIVADVLNSPSTLYAATEIGMLKSLDGGRNWGTINNGFIDINILSLLMDYSQSNILYVGTGSDGVYKTVNGGASWYQVNDGLSSMIVNVLIPHPLWENTIYAGTDDGIFVTSSGAE